MIATFLGTAAAALSLVAPTGAAGSPQIASAGEPEEVVVGTRVVPPFVIELADGSYAGLSVALWGHLARELGIEYRFEERSIEGMLEGVERGALFASAAALAITADREARVDFSHPFFVTGLGIVVADRPAGLRRVLIDLLSLDLLWVLLLLVLLLAFWGTLVWIFERKENQEQFGGRPVHGIGSGFWWAAVTMTTVGYGDKAPRTLAGRVVGFVWMFTAIVVISFFTAAIASSLTVTRLETRVQGPQDLPFARVGGLEGAAPMMYLARRGVGATGNPTISDGLAAVALDEIDAFVHDAPILRYRVRQEFSGQLRVLPGIFQEQYYGIALPAGSELRNAMNQVLLDYLASDEWEALKRRYLGEGG